MYMSNVPFNTVENAYWRRFFTKLNPAYIAAHRNTFAGPLLDQAYAKTKQEVEAKLKGKVLNIVTDESTDVTRNRIVSMSVNSARLTFRAWRELRKMTYSDDIHSFLTIRMPITVFEDLCTWLRKNTEVDGTKGLDIEESVAICLYIVGRNASNRRGSNTVGRQSPGNNPSLLLFFIFLFFLKKTVTNSHFHRVLNTLLLLYNAEVQLPSCSPQRALDRPRTCSS
jgi:hypothetical protein